jgi:hypothetical protein
MLIIIQLSRKYSYCHVTERLQTRLVIRFNEHLYTQLVITGKYNRITGLHTLKISATAAHRKSSYVFTIRCLVTDPNKILC